MSTFDQTREEEYTSERDACEQEAFETFCYEQDIDPATEEAVLAWKALIEREERESYEDRQVAEYEDRMRDLAEERDYLDQ